jgi:histidinol-phosphatase
MDLLEAKNTALSFLKISNKEIMKWFRTNMTVESKSDQSPVTNADRRAEEILRKKISKAYPDHGIIGEEFGEENPQSEWVWTIDPIDGTRSFIRGLPLFASLVALLHKGEPVMGIISLPAFGETTWAVKGKGTFSGDQRLHVSNQGNLKEAFVGTADKYCFKAKKRMQLYNRLHREAEIVRTYPDAFGHLMAIRGAIDIMVDPWAYIWDFAPCKIMVQEAGGEFANFSGSKAGIGVGNALSGNAKMVKALKSMIRKTNNQKKN